MISQIKGTLIHKSPTEITVDVNGVGFSLFIPVSSFEKLPEIGSQVSLLTYLHVREDALHLYGFASEAERSMFILLLSVSGIGPKMAQGILSGIQPIDLQSHILQGNVSALISIPGVGRKTAERLVVELKDKISRIGVGATKGAFPQKESDRIRSEVLMALLSLGYHRPLAEKAIRIALDELAGKEVDVQQLLKLSLRTFTR